MDLSSDKIVYFIRHGKDDSRFRGGWSRKPLVRDGHFQAQRLAERFFEVTDPATIGTVFTSDLPRAVQTSKPICAELGIDPIHKFCWREANNGKLAGMPNVEAERLYPGLYWSSLEPNEHYPDGESPMEFFHRIRRAHIQLREEILSGAIKSDVIVFTHSGVINVLYSLVNRTKWSNKDRSFNIPYTSVHAYNVTQNKIGRYL